MAGLERPGRLPERTIYELTAAGRVEVNDWLVDLLSMPSIEYPRFVAALSFLAALPPEQVLDLLKERLRHLAIEEAQAAATRELVQKRFPSARSALAREETPPRRTGHRR